MAHAHGSSVALQLLGFSVINTAIAAAHALLLDPGSVDLQTWTSSSISYCCSGRKTKVSHGAL